MAETGVGTIGVDTVLVTLMMTLCALINISTIHAITLE
jgi:hypothetical protein